MSERKSKPDQTSKALPAVDPKTPFEAALQEVESIIESIETGEVGLEEALARYERGVGLINHCRAKLDRAEQHVEDLTKRLDDLGEAGGDPDEGEQEDEA